MRSYDINLINKSSSSFVEQTQSYIDSVNEILIDIIESTNKIFNINISIESNDTFPNLESFTIIPGVHINFSKFNSPSLIFSTNSSLPTISAPASLAT